MKTPKPVYRCNVCGKEKTRRANKCCCSVCKKPNKGKDKECTCNTGYCSWCGKYKWLDEGHTYCPACAEDEERIYVANQNRIAEKWKAHYRGKGEGY